MSRASRRDRLKALHYATGSEPRAQMSLRRGAVRLAVEDVSSVRIDVNVPGTKGRNKVIMRTDEVLARFSTGQLLAEIERRLHRETTSVFLDFLESRGDPWGKTIAEFIALRSAKRRPKNR